MALDLMKLIKDAIPPGAVKTAASHLDETPEHTESAISTSAPALLTALADKTDSDEGTSQLKALMVRTTEIHPGITRDVGGYLGCGESQVAKEGASMLEQSLGPHAWTISSAIAQVAGIHVRSARSLVSTLFPLMLGVIHEHTRSTSSAELRALLRAERSRWMDLLPTPIASLFGMSATETPLPSAHDVATPSSPSGPAIPDERVSPVMSTSRQRWLPWVLVVFVGLLAALGLPALGRRDVAVGVEAPVAAPGTATPQLIVIQLPGKKTLALAPASPAAGLARYLGDPNDREPRTFTFMELRTAPGSTKFTPEGTATVDQIAVILRAYPTAHVRVDSHTDAAGNPAINRRATMGQSLVTKQMLMVRGVPASRIDPVGSGSDHPVAPNDTEENRARNRRTEITVTKK